MKQFYLNWSIIIDSSEEYRGGKLVRTNPNGVPSYTPQFNYQDECLFGYLSNEVAQRVGKFVDAGLFN